MTRTTAEMLNALMLKINAELNDSLITVKEREADDVFKKYRSTVGNVMATSLLEVMNPIYAHYPDLEPAELRRPGYSPDKARPFKATHRLRVSDGTVVEVMLHDAGGGYAHTHEQWAAFQRAECIPKPFWILVGQRWWRNNEDLAGGVQVEALD